jgi:hypothetical protein
MSKFTRFFLPVPVYFILGALVFPRALGVGFLCDGAGNIFPSLTTWTGFAAQPHQFWLPAILIFNLLYHLLQLNPLYHSCHDQVTPGKTL